MNHLEDSVWASPGMSGRQQSSLPENVSQNERLASMIAGVIIASQVLRRGSIGTLLGTALAGGLIYRSVTGHCHLYDLLERSGLYSPTGQLHDRGHWSQVDMESDHSFPASDPPSWSGATT